MNAGEWAAVVGIALTTVGGIAAGVVHSNQTSFKFGQHSERLKQAEQRIKDLEAAEKDAQGQKTDVAVLTSLVEALKQQIADLGADTRKRLDQFEHDMRNILTGKVQPARRPGRTAD